MQIFDKLDGGSFFRFIVAAFIVLGAVRLLALTGEKLEQRALADEQIVAPTPLPCNQPYIWQNAETGQVILRCEPFYAPPAGAAVR